MSTAKKTFLCFVLATLYCRYFVCLLTSSKLSRQANCDLQFFISKNFIFMEATTRKSLPTFILSKFPVVAYNSLKICLKSADNQRIIKFRTHLRIIIMYNNCRHAENYFISQFSSSISSHPEYYFVQSWEISISIYNLRN